MAGGPSTAPLGLGRSPEPIELKVAYESAINPSAVNNQDAMP